MMRALELKVPPLALLALFGLLVLVVRLWGDGPQFGFPGRIIVAGLALTAGLACMAAGVLAFRRARTSVNPLDPSVATALVTTGIYRVTRNPMYLGMALTLTALVVALGHTMTIFLIPAFMLWLTRFQIMPEERFLASRFGADWLAWKGSTRRWI